ncbi:MAG: ABC transporter permease [Actinomycetota bacterium]
MRLVNLAWKNLQRHRVRTVLTVMGIVVSAMTLFAILSFNSGYDKALNEEMTSSGAHLYISMEGCPMQAASLVLHGGEIPTYLDQLLLTYAQAIPEVRAAGGMLISTVISGGKADLFYGITDEIRELKPKWELEGSWFEGPDSVILGYDLAKDFGKQPGDTMFIESLDREFQVSGTLRKNGSEDDGFYFLPLATAQEIFARPSQLTIIAVQLKDTSYLRDVQTQLEKRGAYVVPSTDITELISDTMGGTKSMLLVIVVIVLLVAGLFIFNTILMATFERNQEFGFLRCVGAHKKHIFGLIAIETMLICAAGALLGVTAGYFLSFAIDGWIRGFLAYAPAGQILRPDLAGMLLTLGVVFVVGALAGLYPGYRASRVSPIEAVHNE